MNRCSLMTEHTHTQINNNNNNKNKEQWMEVCDIVQDAGIKTIPKKKKCKKALIADNGPVFMQLLTGLCPERPGGL